MNYASLDTVHIESVLVHESHAAQQENPPSQRTKRLIAWVDVHFHDGSQQGEDPNFFGYQKHVQRPHGSHKQRGKQRELAFGLHVLGGFHYTLEEFVKINKVVNWNNFAFFGDVHPVYYTTMRAA